MQEEYKRNADFRSYVDSYCSQYRKTVDEALLDLVVQAVRAQYREERHENKNKPDAG